MHRRRVDLFLASRVVDQIRTAHLQMLFCLMMVSLFVLPGMCRAGEMPLQMVTASETLDRTMPAVTPSPETADRDPAELEELMARKVALEQERAELEKEQARLAEQGQRVRATRAIWKLNNDLKELSARFASHQEKRDAFDGDWDAYYSSLKDLPELQELRARKAALDAERGQLDKEQAELAGQGRKVKNRREIRWHKHQLQELNARIAAYQKKRNTFEKDWYAFYSEH